MNVFENDSLRIIVGVSCINHIKINYINSDLGVLNKINDIQKKKRLKLLDM